MLGMMNALAPHELAAACICMNLQKAARRVAQRYDRALKPVGLTSGQFSIIGALQLENATPLGVLAAVLGMDRTTLTRNLRPLAARGLVADAPGADDQRVRGLCLTPAGRDLHAAALPLWHEAQAEGLGRIGSSAWPGMRAQLATLGDAG